MAKPSIRTEVAKAQAARAACTEIEADEVLRQGARIAFVDPRQMMDAQGQFVPLQDLPDDIAPAGQSSQAAQKQSNGATPRVYKVRFADRNASVDKLMRHLGHFERPQVQSGGGLAELLGAIEAAGSRLPAHR